MLGCSQDVAEMIWKGLCVPSSHNWIQEEKEGEVKYGSNHTGDGHENGEQNTGDPAGEKEEDEVWAQLNSHTAVYRVYSFSIRSHLQQQVMQHTHTLKFAECQRIEKPHTRW